MGNLLQLLRKEDSNNFKLPDNVFLDFENALPGPADQDLYEIVDKVLAKTVDILEGLRAYTGATDPIREAIKNNDCEKSQVTAWKAVCPLVNALNTYYQYSIELDKQVVELLTVLCSEPPMESLENHQALAKQFAHVLDFVLAFDDLKMTNPSIQNDFSFYRRMRNRVKAYSEAEEHEVSNEVANRMSMFYAYPTPMLKMLSNSVTSFVKKNQALPLENTTDIFSTMANLCRCMIEDPQIVARFQQKETTLFVLRVMVGAIILYDHVHPVGAFYRKSNIDIKSSIKLLKDQPPNTVETLLNALRYSTVHANDEETPSVVKKLLAE
ncbi:CYFIP-related Rac1 interactor B-like isoform X2 [Bolinopsis microptera]|uniref:CYFIP-related Rac1 interactor B-like isoform X2 n=1 Tax=Bolinopsis microptera TaxID=2820187 RepID=UPI003078C485